MGRDMQRSLRLPVIDCNMLFNNDHSRHPLDTIVFANDSLTRMHTLLDGSEIWMVYHAQLTDTPNNKFR